MLHTKYTGQHVKIKELSLNSVLAAVYWWPDLSEGSIDGMRAVVMCHNVDGECCVSMTLWDEVLSSWLRKSTFLAVGG